MNLFLFYAKIHFGLGAISVIIWALIEKYRPKVLQDKVDKAMDYINETGSENLFSEAFVKNLVFFGGFLVGPFAAVSTCRNILLLISKEK